jgi:hypothetical protein
MNIEQVAIKSLCSWGRVEPRKRDELYELRLFDPVAALKQIVIDIMIENLIYVALNFDVFIHQNSTFEILCTFLDLPNGLCIFLFVDLIQLVEDGIVNHFENLLEMVL